MLFWFVLGYLAHDLVLRGAAWLSHRNVWLGFSGLSVSVLIMLTSTIMMLQVVRPGLGMSFVGEDDDEAVTGPLQEDEGLVDNIAEALLPFLIFYSAWELYVDEVREWSVKSVNQNLDAGLEALGALSGDRLDRLILVPLGIALASYLLRAFSGYFYGRTKSRILGLVVALFEANWMFFAVISVSTVIRQAQDWLTGRVFWVELRTAVVGYVDALAEILPGVTFPQVAEAWAWLTARSPDLMDGLALPLVWLTITAAVYGEEMDRDAKVVEGTRFERVAENFQRLSSRMRRSADLLTSELREKWTPFANGVRLIWQAGPLFFLTFCFLYVVLEWLAALAYRGVLHLVGPHPFDWWWAKLGPLEFATDAVHEVLRIALLAAAFGIALRQARIRRRARARAVFGDGSAAVSPGAPTGTSAPSGASGPVRSSGPAAVGSAPTTPGPAGSSPRPWAPGTPSAPAGWYQGGSGPYRTPPPGTHNRS